MALIPKKNGRPTERRHIAIEARRLVGKERWDFDEAMARNGYVKIAIENGDL